MLYNVACAGGTVPQRWIEVDKGHGHIGTRSTVIWHSVDWLRSSMQRDDDEIVAWGDAHLKSCAGSVPLRHPAKKT